MVIIFTSDDSITKAYARCARNFADNAVSVMRLATNIIFSKMDSWKSILLQAKDKSRHLLVKTLMQQKLLNKFQEILSAATVTAQVKDANSRDNLALNTTIISQPPPQLLHKNKQYKI